jgi:uncharacterized 2Fe-2S/4Fe-4S cluster protein (DUF4445 family)
MPELGAQFITSDGTSLRLEPSGAGSLLAAVRSLDPAAIDAPCGGAGTCGKCRVLILEGDAGRPDDQERRVLGSGPISAGIRLACRVKPSAGLVARRSVAPGSAVIRESFSAMEGAPDTLAHGAGHYGVALDIGTTTMAAYLVDFGSRRVTASASRLNSQRAFGADVIARIDYACRDPAGLAELASLSRGDARALIEQLLARGGAGAGALREISVVGNTTMLHLFAGVDPSGIAVAPFTPAFTELRRGPASAYGLPWPDASLTLGPSVAGYVGADIVAAIRAVGMERRERLSLLLDLGTNGEMALGNRDGIVACATAAGPAFEGAAISCGTGGVAGAIDSLRWEDGRLVHTTIGGGPPIGVCGSGIIDAAACLVRGGLVDDSGALDAAWSAAGYPLALTDSAGDSGGAGIYFSQADLRQIQLAKAAVAAGIAAMLDEAGAGLDDIETVFLAGGFGSYLRPESAAAIGLIPPALLSRVDTVGNAAGHGAVRMLLFRDELDSMSGLARAVRYIELSGSDFFRDRFVEELFFPAPADPVTPRAPAASAGADRP